LPPVIWSAAPCQPVPSDRPESEIPVSEPDVPPSSVRLAVGIVIGEAGPESMAGVIVRFAKGEALVGPAAVALAVLTCGSSYWSVQGPYRAGLDMVSIRLPVSGA